MTWVHKRLGREVTSHQGLLARAKNVVNKRESLRVVFELQHAEEASEAWDRQVVVEPEVQTGELQVPRRECKQVNGPEERGDEAYPRVPAGRSRSRIRNVTKGSRHGG